MIASASKPKYQVQIQFQVRSEVLKKKKRNGIEMLIISMCVTRIRVPYWYWVWIKAMKRNLRSLRRISVRSASASYLSIYSIYSIYSIFSSINHGIEIRDESLKEIMREEAEQIRKGSSLAGRICSARLSLALWHWWWMMNEWIDDDGHDVCTVHCSLWSDKQYTPRFRDPITSSGGGWERSKWSNVP